MFETFGIYFHDSIGVVKQILIHRVTDPGALFFIPSVLTLLLKAIDAPCISPETMESKGLLWKLKQFKYKSQSASNYGLSENQMCRLYNWISSQVPL